MRKLTTCATDTNAGLMPALFGAVSRPGPQTLCRGEPIIEQLAQQVKTFVFAEELGCLRRLITGRDPRIAGKSPGRRSSRCRSFPRRLRNRDARPPRTRPEIDGRHLRPETCRVRLPTPLLLVW